MKGGKVTYAKIDLLMSHGKHVCKRSTGSVENKIHNRATTTVEKKPQVTRKDICLRKGEEECERVCFCLGWRVEEKKN